jgi:tetratricopeptide (TPR) repeat protein
MTERAVTVDEALAIASAQRRAGHLDEAESILRQILEARPSHPTGWHELALAVNASGRHSEALDAVAAAIDADPASGDLHATRGEVLAALGRPEEAVAAVEIFDSDFHELDPARRRGGTPNTAHVDIGANVFVGSEVKILKGVTIGANTVVGNGAIVTASLPADVIAVGSPARVLRAL